MSLEDDDYNHSPFMTTVYVGMAFGGLSFFFSCLTVWLIIFKSFKLNGYLLVIMAMSFFQVCLDCAFFVLDPALLLDNESLGITFNFLFSFGNFGW